MTPDLDVRVSRQCRRAHHRDCRGCDCSCHPDGTVDVPEPEQVPPPDPIIPATEPVAPPPPPEPPRAAVPAHVARPEPAPEQVVEVEEPRPKAAPRKRAARPAGTGSPAAMRAATPAPAERRREVKVDAETAAMIDAIPDGELRVLLCGLSEFMVGILMVDRHTVGGQWRIAQEILA